MPKHSLFSIVLPILLMVICERATAYSLPFRPLTDEEASLFRLLSVTAPFPVSHAQPWTEADFAAISLGGSRERIETVSGESNRDRKIAALQEHYASENRHLLTFPTRHIETTGDAGFETTYVSRRSDSETRQLGIVSVRARVAANFHGGWTLLNELVSRFEAGDPEISPYHLEFNTYESDSYRLPNVLQTYLTWQGEWFSLSAGRQPAHFGPGIHGSLLLSDISGAKPMLRGKANVGWLKFTFLTALLTGPKPVRFTVPKYLSAHRLEVTPTDGLNLGVSETVVFAERFDVKFLNPFDLYFLDDSLTQPNNRNLSLDAAWVFTPGYQIYGELFVDDYQPQLAKKSFRAWNSKGGILTGFLCADPLGFQDTSLAAEFAFVNQFAYTHETSATQYSDNGVPLGHPIGTDAESVWLRIERYLTPNLRVSAEWERIRSGEGDITKRHPQHGTNPQNVKGPERWEYLSGIVETVHHWELALRRVPVKGWTAEGRAIYERASNVGNVTDVKKKSIEGVLSVGYGF